MLVCVFFFFFFFGMCVGYFFVCACVCLFLCIYKCVFPIKFRNSDGEISEIFLMKEY